MDHRNAAISIDPEFKALIPPLTPDEYRQLDENIRADGCLDTIKTWGGVILDGHNRYEICTAHNIPYRTEEIALDSREDAIVWICKNQTGRRNITQEQKMYLLGKQYEATKKLRGNMTGARNEAGQFVQIPQSGGIGQISTEKRVAQEMGVGKTTVYRAGQYASGLDAAGAIDPEFKREVLAGKSPATKTDIQAITRIPAPERPAAVEKLKRGEKLAVQEKPSEKPAPQVSFKAIVANLKDMNKSTSITPEIFIAEYEAFADEIVHKFEWYKQEPYVSIYPALSRNELEKVTALNTAMSRAVVAIDALQKGRTTK